VALGIAAIGSFFAGTVATVLIAALGVPLTKLALSSARPNTSRSWSWAWSSPSCSRADRS
jgi:hypothetical protein